ncbi:MAG TPA: hypothetical protein VI893_00050, partial [Thermoplasmata archaeon]|nr:hypothetical protein [Thermoplasmata archaeon]
MRAKRAMGALALLALTLMAFSVAGSGAAPASAPAEIGFVDSTPVSTPSDADGPDCRDVAAMIQRVSAAIRDMEARLN